MLAQGTFVCTCTMGVSVPSLHRESSDSLIHFLVLRKYLLLSFLDQVPVKCTWTCTHGIGIEILKTANLGTLHEPKSNTFIVQVISPVYLYIF